MEGAFPLFADFFSDQVNAATRGDQLNARDLLLGCVIIFCIAAAIFIGVYLRFRRKRLQVDRARISQSTAAFSSSGTSTTTDESGRQRRRKRRRRREHRPRNPSLQQTGGLPPPRPEDELPKF